MNLSQVLNDLGICPPSDAKIQDVFREIAMVQESTSAIVGEARNTFEQGCQVLVLTAIGHEKGRRRQPAHATGVLILCGCQRAVGHVPPRGSWCVQTAPALR